MKNTLKENPINQKKLFSIKKFFAFRLEPRSYNLEAGFGLLEAMVSIFIMIVGVTGAMTLVSGGILNIGVAEDRLIAINLAQEGLEIVHNIRDNNWLNSDLADPVPVWNDWDGDGGADNCDDGCTRYVLWNSTDASENSSLKDLRWNGSTGHYDAGGIGTGGKFSRIITIFNNPDNDINTSDVSIKSTVGWGGTGNCTDAGIDSGSKYCITLEERLYDWLQ